MDLIHPQLAAFSAVIEEGSFETAARRLCVTSSAISQRIKALEDRLGQLLIVRQPPCRPTPAGELLLRRVKPMQLLEAEALADFLPSEQERTHLRPITIAANDDSLETWLLSALAELHHQHGYMFDIRVDDQDHTLSLLREGSVLGAITSEALPVQGCKVSPLGIMSYRAIASPDFAERYFKNGVDAHAFSLAPMIVFNRKDELQWRFMRRITRAKLNPPIHYLPTATGFVKAAALGLGWCLTPESLIGSAIEERKIVNIASHLKLDVALYWQHAAVQSEILRQIGAALRACFRS